MIIKNVCSMPQLLNHTQKLFGKMLIDSRQIFKAHYKNIKSNEIDAEVSEQIYIP